VIAKNIKNKIRIFLTATLTLLDLFNTVNDKKAALQSDG
jgi:hypothetical protein